MVSKKKYPTRINKTLLERFFIITLYVLYFSAVIKKKSSGDIFIVIIFHQAEFLWRQFFFTAVQSCWGVRSHSFIVV